MQRITGPTGLQRRLTENTSDANNYRLSMQLGHYRLWMQLGQRPYHEEAFELGRCKLGLLPLSSQKLCEGYPGRSVERKAFK